MTRQVSEPIPTQPQNQCLEATHKQEEQRQPREDSPEGQSFPLLPTCHPLS